MASSELFVNENYGLEHFVGGQITHQWIVDCLENNDNDFNKCRGTSKIIKIDGIDISDGKGFLSKVFKTSIYFDDKKKEPYHTIIKIPGDDSIRESLKKQNLEENLTEEDINLDHIATFHNKECFFYSNIALKIKNLKYPKCYGFKDLIVGKQVGALIMQFIGSNSKTIPFYRGLNIHQTESIINEVFKLQEYSLHNPNGSWKGVFQPPFPSDQIEKMENIIRTSLPTAKKYVPKNMWLDISDELEKMLSNYTKILKYITFELPTSDGNEPVLSHGDMWINNFMFKTDSMGNSINDLSAVIDWQTVYEGNTGCDIARILAVSVPHDIRRELETYHLPDFYQKLKDSLEKEGKKMKISYETFLNNYKICFIEQSLLLLLMIGFALQEYNVPDDSDYIWDARKFNIGSRVYYALIDAIKYCKELRPEWLEKND